MEKNVLVIVESPTKAKTIKKFLPAHFSVEASIGHVRDLPQTAGEIPAKYRKLEWAKIGIDVENNFTPLYVIPKEKAAIVKRLKALVKDASEVYLATDEDREGESISWHLVEVLSPQVPIKRMVFHEITEKAIQASLLTTRAINKNLVIAQETRRLLDRLYGYTISPLLWKKITYGLSAGRVQSPGIRLIVERELARCRFQSAEYWDLSVQLEKSQVSGNGRFTARLSEIAGKRVATGKDFDPETGQLFPQSNGILLSENEAKALEVSLRTQAWVVSNVQEKETLWRPSAPFITSTLQQEANRKLGFTARETMRLAQKLYEEGFITYMRTDSPALSDEALDSARTAIENLYGKDYLSPSMRRFTAKSKNAQESHEAIRPATPFLTVEQTGLEARERALYELIWKRALASQMPDAKKKSTSAFIQVDQAVFLATGTRILFPGFLRLYVEGKDDQEQVLDNMETFLPDLQPGDRLEMKDLKAERHMTKPPVRFTEASLVQRLEKEGIGRPSTYATIIGTLQERGYVFKKDNALVPTFTGMAVVTLLDRHFYHLVNYEFTFEMEKKLDEIAVGQVRQLDYLKEFYLGNQGLKHIVESTEALINPDTSRTMSLPQLGEDQNIKLGRFGAYVISTKPDGTKVNATLPQDIAPADLKPEEILLLLTQQEEGAKPLGYDPVTNKPLFVLLGRFGPHLQLGEKKEGEKPRTMSLPSGLSMKDITLELALKLFSLPRNLGLHPQTGHQIIANRGRFGPFVACNGEFRSLKKNDDLFTITLERALELFSEEKKSRSNKKIIKEFAAEETTLKRQVTILSGQFGAYIKVGGRNISLPDEFKSSEKASTLTLSMVQALIEKASAKKPAAVSRSKKIKSSR